MKKQSEERIAQLIQQWPAIEECLAKNNRGWKRSKSKDEIHIFVKRVDENLMMVRPEWIDGKRGWICNTKLRGVIGTVHEKIVACNAKHEVLAEIGRWSPSDAAFPFRVKDLIAAVQARSLVYLGDNTIAYFVRVFTRCWHKEVPDYWQQDNGSPLGRFVGRVITVGVYRKPRKRSIERVAEETDIMRNVHISERDIMDSMGTDEAYREVYEKLRELGKKFEREVFLKGLYKVISATPQANMSGMFGSVELLSFVTAGRVMLTFRRGAEQITYVAADSAKDVGTGLQSIQATLPAAQEIVQEVIDGWNNSEAPPSERFRHDPKVSIL